jgi:hypothetical protein
MNTFRLKNRIDDAKFIDACNSSLTMMEAAKKLNCHFNSFKRRAVKLGCYRKNQGSKGSSKPKVEGKGKIPLSEILSGKHPYYQTFKLKLRLLKENIKQNVCEVCKTGPDWNNKPINCELDHIDGDSSNHLLKNLRMLCPNCHSQTETFRAKNKR